MTASSRVLILFLFFVVIISCGTSIANATTYYVDFDSGSDTNNGTSTSTPWLNVPGTCTTATSSQSSCSYPSNSWATLQAGDIVKIKSGTSHTSADAGRINITSAYYSTGASVANPITIQRDTSWGSGSVTIDGTSITLPSGGFGLLHIKVAGIKVDGIAGVSGSYDGIIIENSQYCGISQYPTSDISGPTIAYLKLYNNGTQYAAAENASDGQLRVFRSTGGSIANCELDGNNNMLQAISFAGDDVRVVDFTVTNCIAYNHSGTNDGGIAFKGVNSQITFTNCTAYNNYKGFDLGQNGDLDTTLAWDVTYKVINSTIYANTYGCNFNYRGMLSGTVTGAVNFYIINCIIRDNTAIGSKVYAGPYNLFVIHSVYDGNPINLTVGRDGLSDTRTMNFYAYNSIFYKPTTTSGGNVDHLYWTNTGDPLTIHSDYNSYIQNNTEYFSQFGGYGGGSDVVNFSYGANGPGHSSGSWYDFKSWNNDAHSVGTGATVTTLPPFRDVSGNDYTLTSSYAGKDLSAEGWYISEMGTDKNGISRTAWDIGAYEYTNTGTISNITIGPGVSFR